MPVLMTMVNFDGNDRQLLTFLFLRIVHPILQQYIEDQIILFCSFIVKKSNFFKNLIINTSIIYLNPSQQPLYQSNTNLILIRLMSTKYSHSLDARLTQKFWSSLNSHNNPKTNSLLNPLSTDSQGKIFHDSLLSHEKGRFIKKKGYNLNKQRQSLHDLAAWVNKKLSIFSGMRIPTDQWFSYKQEVLNYAIGEIITKTKAEEKQRGEFLESILQNILEHVNKVMLFYKEKYQSWEFQRASENNFLHRQYQNCIDELKTKYGGMQKEHNLLTKFKKEVVRLNRKLAHQNRIYKREQRKNSYKYAWLEIEYKSVLEQNLYLQLQKGSEVKWLRQRFKKIHENNISKKAARHQQQLQIQRGVTTDMRWAVYEIWQRFMKEENIEIDAFGIMDEEERRDVIIRSEKKLFSQFKKKKMYNVHAWKDQIKKNNLGELLEKQSLTLPKQKIIQQSLFDQLGSKNHATSTQDLIMLNQCGIICCPTMSDQASSHDRTIEWFFKANKYTQQGKICYEKGIMTDGQHLRKNEIKQIVKEVKIVENQVFEEQEDLKQKPKEEKIDHKEQKKAKSFKKEKRQTLKLAKNDSPDNEHEQSTIKKRLTTKNQLVKKIKKRSGLSSQELQKPSNHPKVINRLRRMQKNVHSENEIQEQHPIEKKSKKQEIRKEYFHQYYKRIKKRKKSIKAKKQPPRYQKKRTLSAQQNAPKRQVIKVKKQESNQLLYRMQQKQQNLNEFDKRVTPSNILNLQKYEKTIDSFNLIVQQKPQRRMSMTATKKIFVNSSRIFNSIIAQFCKILQKTPNSLESVICSIPKFEKVMYPINVIIHQKFMNKFGLKSVAEKNMKTLIQTITALQYDLPEAQLFSRLCSIHPDSTSQDLYIYVRLVLFLQMPHQQRAQINLFKTSITRKEFLQQQVNVFESYFSKQDISELEVLIFPTEDVYSVELNILAIHCLRLFSTRIKETEIQAIPLLFNSQYLEFDHFIRMLFLLKLPLEQEIFFQRSFLSFCDLTYKDKKCMTKRRYFAFCYRFKFLTLKKAIAHVRNKCQPITQPFPTQDNSEIYLQLKLKEIEDGNDEEMKELLRWMSTLNVMQNRIHKGIWNGLEGLESVKIGIQKCLEWNVRKK